MARRLIAYSPLIHRQYVRDVAQPPRSRPSAVTISRRNLPPLPSPLLLRADDASAYALLREFAPARFSARSLVVAKRDLEWRNLRARSCCRCLPEPQDLYGHWYSAPLLRPSQEGDESSTRTRTSEPLRATTAGSALISDGRSGSPGMQPRRKQSQGIAWILEIRSLEVRSPCTKLYIALRRRIARPEEGIARSEQTKPLRGNYISCVVEFTRRSSRLESIKFQRAAVFFILRFSNR